MESPYECHEADPYNSSALDFHKVKSREEIDKFLTIFFPEFPNQAFVHIGMLTTRSDYGQADKQSIVKFGLHIRRVGKVLCVTPRRGLPSLINQADGSRE